ncbi:MAG: hypothetical protein M5R36_05765 [Deltaproteobacteria bacterium]|nr:hypothetical protein [Deltaproteobacteria bacterium]
METILREGLSMEFFIEGGRSRIGKVLPPKLGFISILLDALRASGQSDLAFIPVSIDYERIFEEKIFVDEANAKKSERGKLKTAIDNRRMVKRRIGDIHIVFNEPVTVGRFLAETGHAAVPDSREDQKDLAGRIAYDLTWTIAQNFPVRPTAMLATVLLANAKRGLLLADFVRRAKLLYEYLLSRSVRLTGRHWANPDWPLRLVDQALRDRWIRREGVEEENEEVVLILDEDRRMPLTIHRNSILHFYQELALTSLAFRAADGPAPPEKLYESFRFAKELLSAEMIYGSEPTQSPETEREMFDNAMEYFFRKRVHGLQRPRNGADRGGRGCRAPVLQHSRFLPGELLRGRPRALEESRHGENRQGMDPQNDEERPIAAGPRRDRVYRSRPQNAFRNRAPALR